MPASVKPNTILRTPPSRSRGPAVFSQPSHLGHDDMISPSLYLCIKKSSQPSHLWGCVMLMAGAFGSISYVTQRSTLSQALARMLETVGEGVLGSLPGGVGVGGI